MTIREKLDGVRAALGSKQALLAAIETRESAQGRLADRNPWTNEDLDISPRKDWTWGWWDYAAFWWSYGFSTGVWTAGSSLVSLGLTWWQAIICIFLSHFLGAVGMVMHSRSSATYHFGFPIASRIPWGLRGGYFPVFVRVLVGTIWVGVQLVQGGYFVAVLFRAVFGNGFANMANPIPASQYITSQQLVGLVVFWVATLPLLSVPIPKIRVLFTIKSFVLPPIVIGLFVFCMLQGRGSGASAGSYSGAGTLHGSALAWAMLGGVNSVMGKTSTSIVNQPDLARYARTRTAPTWSQLVALPVGNTLCATLGIFGTSAVAQAWGELIWNPWDLCGAILDRDWGHGARAGVAVVALGFILSIFGSNMGANVIPWGADTTVLVPRFINIRRGMYLSYVLGIVICPWRILESASSFLQFLGGYSIFLGPFVGIFLTDYLVCRRGNVYVADLYSPSGRYWYRGGVHWRAAVAYVVAVVLPIPGFAQTFDEPVPVAWLRIYQVGWLLTCTLSSVVYWLLCFVGGRVATEEKQLAFEAIAWEQMEPYLEPRHDVLEGQGEPAVATVGLSNEPKS
ncbi:permease for cytosine/purines, uracil, thiamine, allantoin-domain-containing protein [Xylariaceae sp. FL0804]|nr:permease for cytosine/purines, uracil, thiamine, allantoin-domain-containing protein [Xylariaceae sp. FL0804]